MKITDLNLLIIDVYDGEQLIYTGMCDEAPEDLKQKQIQVKGIEGKKLILLIK